MPHGYTGKILVADLTAMTLSVDEHDDAWYRARMGGAAVAMDYILREMPRGADPLGPDNVLVFAVGPLTGTPISGQSRMSVNCRSPLTGAIGDAQVGGFFPAELKMAGFDAVVVKGRAATRPISGSRTARSNCATPRPTGGWGPGTSRTR